MFEWTEKLAVGVDTNDAQHREQFASINLLLNENGTATPVEISNVVAFLDDYVNNHFGMEDIYIPRLSYAGYTFNKRKHVFLFKEFYDLRDGSMPTVPPRRSPTGKAPSSAIGW